MVWAAVDASNARVCMRSHSSCPVIEYANSFRVATLSRVGSGPSASRRFSNSCHLSSESTISPILPDSGDIYLLIDDTDRISLVFSSSCLRGRRNGAGWLLGYPCPSGAEMACPRHPASAASDSHTREHPRRSAVRCDRAVRWQGSVEVGNAGPYIRSTRTGDMDGR